MHHQRTKHRKIKKPLAEPNALITIRTFSYPTQAYLAKSLLEAYGVEAFVADDYIVAMNWLYSNTVGGVKIQVRKRDVPAAIKLLERVREPLDWEKLPDDFPGSAGRPRCPRCRSTETQFIKYERRLLFLSWLILSFPLPFVWPRWHCKDCGHRWKIPTALG